MLTSPADRRVRQHLRVDSPAASGIASTITSWKGGVELLVDSQEGVSAGEMLVSSVT